MESHLKDEMAWYDSVAKGYVSSERPLASAKVEGLVVDVACGTGDFSFYFRGDLNVGCDISRGMLLEARRKGVEVIQAELSNLPFADSSCAAVSCFHALGEHVPLELGTPELSRVLRTDGLLAFTTIPRRPLISKMLKMAARKLGRTSDYTLNRFSADEGEIKKALRSNGFGEPKLQLVEGRMKHIFVETEKIGVGTKQSPGR